MNPAQYTNKGFESAQLHDPDRLLTVEDLAARLQVSSAWVRDHASRKQPRLPVVRVGKMLRFRGDEIDRWIMDHSQRPC
jgi:excisionase family DNA binding protein